MKRNIRLTSHLMRADVIQDVFRLAQDIAHNDSNFELNVETVAAIDAMAISVNLEPEDTLRKRADNTIGNQYVQIILEGSLGIDTHKDDEEFEVDGVFFSPQFGRLAYRGKHISEKNKAEKESWRHSKTTISVPVDHIVPLEGESKLGFYNLESGEITTDQPIVGEF